MDVVQNRFLELLAQKARREGRKITRRQAAKETGISLTSVQNWSANTVRQFHSHQIAVFCKYLDCTVDELLVIEDVAEIKKSLMMATM